jgi:acyl carrier protein
VTRPELIALIEELLEKDAGTLEGPETLEDNGWDSLSVVSFIALIDEHLEYTVPPKRLAACKTVDDLVSLVADRLAPV